MGEAGRRGNPGFWFFVLEACGGLFEAAVIHVSVKSAAGFMLEQTKKVKLAVAGNPCSFRQRDIASGGLCNVTADCINDLLLEVGLCVCSGSSESPTDDAQEECRK